MARPLLLPEDLRKPVKLFLTSEERTAVETKALASGLALSTFVRKVALGQRVVSLPTTNAEQWEKLARLSANLNQLARAANSGSAVSVDPDLLAALSVQVRRLRFDLLGLEDGE